MWSHDTHVTSHVTLFIIIRLLSRQLYKKELEPQWPPPEKVSATPIIISGRGLCRRGFAVMGLGYVDANRVHSQGKVGDHVTVM